MTKPQPKKIDDSVGGDSSAAIPNDHAQGPQPALLVEVVDPSLEVTPPLDTEIAAADKSDLFLLPSLTPTPTYTTAFYQDNGIPTCNVCGEKYRTDRHGLPLCPVDAVDCPRK